MTMKTPKPQGRGRPKLPPEKKFASRHVVNLSREMDQAVKSYCEANGIGRHTDGLRQLLVKALKAEGMMV